MLTKLIARLVTPLAILGLGVAVQARGDDGQGDFDAALRVTEAAASSSRH